MTIFILDLDNTLFDTRSIPAELTDRLHSRLRTRPSMRRFELMSLLRDELAGRARCEVQTVILLDDLHRAIGDLSVPPRSRLVWVSPENRLQKQIRRQP